MGESPSGRGLLDTSVVIGVDSIDSALLPVEIAISTLTLAELTVGPIAASDELERARRQNRLLRFEAGVEALPFDLVCARAYAGVYVAVSATGRKARGAGAVDLMIASTAVAHRMPLYTMNAKDLRGLEQVLEIVDVGAGPSA